MPDIVVFDIETYRPDWRIRRTRREDLDPARNSIITVGVFDGEELSISPIIQNLEDEGRSVEFFLSKLGEYEGATLVGYNILHFDVPYVIYKSKPIAGDVDLAPFRQLDLFWILPHWFHNVPTGQAFFEQYSNFGNLWKFSDVVNCVLKEKPNPFSNLDVLRLWEERRFDDIKTHLEVDLIHTFSLFESQAVQEALNNLHNQHLDTSHCRAHCPYQQPLQRTPERASHYCTLLRETGSEEKALPAIDVVDYPLPGWDVSWVPQCVE
jgi:hypothetical protein